MLLLIVIFPLCLLLIAAVVLGCGLYAWRNSH